jgi:hypothetical protein
MSGTELDLPQTMDANPAPEDEVAQSGDRPLTARELIMQKAVANREASIAHDNAQAAIYSQEATEAGLNFEPDDPDPVPEPAARDVPPPAQVRQATHPAAPVPVPQAPSLRTLDWQGQQYTVTDDQMAELARLGMTTNVALHQYQQPPAETRAPEPPKPIVDPDMVRETVRKIQYGGEDDATQALADFVTNVVSRVPQSPQIDPTAIVNRAVAESRAQAQLAMDAETIRQEYRDIFEHPQREFLAKINVDAIRQRNAATGARQSDLDIYREAGNMVRDAMGQPRPGSEQIPPALQAASNVVPLRQDVIERKRAAPRATQAIDMRSPAPVATRPPTGSEIVERMRQARGQSSMR